MSRGIELLTLPLAPLVLLAGCSGSSTDKASPAATPVRVAVSTSINGSSSVTGSGTAAYEREATLSFRVGGVLRNLAVDVGDRIRVGQPLGRLIGVDVTEQLAGRVAELQRAERTLARLDTLATSGAIAVSEAQDQRDVVRQARAAVGASRYDQSSTSLTSPFAGVVLERLSQTGETVTAGQGILRVADLRSGFIVRVPLSPADADRVALGAAAEVQFGDTRPIVGRVSRIQPLANGATGTRSIEVRLSGPAAAESGSIATVRIATLAQGRDDSLVIVPAEAFVPQAGGRAGVFTVSDGRRARFRPVRLVRFEGDMAVLSGLPAQTRVITAGAGYVKNGDAVVIGEGSGS